MKQTRILHLTLKKRWFDEILAGTKNVEYREIKPYWTKRLFDENGKPKSYDFILFRNGYSKDARKMKVEFRGVEKVILKEDLAEWKKSKEVYGIFLGKIKNLKG